MASRRDSRPRHEQVAADLRALIMSGDLPAGAQLPSTQHLVSRYNAANTTIQRALTALKAEGFLTSQVGKGVYVRDRQPFVIRAGAYFPPRPAGYAYRLLDVAEIVPPADVASTFRLPEGGTAILRRRLMAHNAEPVELSWSYYPLSVAAETALARRAKIPGGAPQVLADLGYPQRSFVDRLSARAPTTDELEALDLPDDVPVIRQFRIIYTDGDQPVEASILIKGAHRYELMYREPINGDM